MKHLSLFVLLVFSISVAVCALFSDPGCGVSIDPLMNKWTATITANSSSKFCYASIITSQWLLGSAACISDRIPLAKYSIQLPFIRGIAEIEKVIKSPNYNPTLGAGYDLALIKAKRTMQFNAGIEPICLADYDSSDPTKVEVNTECYDVIGNFRIRMSDDKRCQGVFHNIYKPEYMFCGDHANCNGVKGARNGAPIICSYGERWYLAAMASWGRNCTQVQPAYEPYTKLFGSSNYIAWINSTIHPTKYLLD